MNGRKIFLGALAVVFLSTAPALPAKAAEPASQTTADTAPEPTVNRGGAVRLMERFMFLMSRDGF